MKKLRLLKPSEIECRVGGTDKQTKASGKLGILLYIDSRCVTKYLDEHFGCLNWQTEFYEVNGQIMGKLGIWDESKSQWIWKSDTGSESNIEAEKGLISDCYKRLLSRWGVTELYSSPQIYVDEKIAKYLKVKEIEYDEDERIITKLVLCDGFGRVHFEWSKENGQIKQNKAITDTNSTMIDEIVVEQNESKEEKKKRLLDSIKKQYREQSGKLDEEMIVKICKYYKKQVEEDKYNFNDFNLIKVYNSWMQREKKVA